MGVEESVKNLLKALNWASPSYNELTHMLFILPQRATTLIKMYPELMEREEMLIELLGIRYTEQGLIEPRSNTLAAHLANLFHSLFCILSHPEMRRELLDMAGIKEDEFKEFDPLRSWIKVSIETLSNINRDTLRLLDIITTKLSVKKPGESVSWEEVKKEVSDIKDFDSARNVLKRFFLLPYGSEYSIYTHECPLLLDAYSDLRSKLKELLR